MTRSRFIRNSHIWLLVGVAVAGLVMTGLIALEAREWSDELARSQFEEAAHLRIQLEENELRRQIDQLDSLQRFISQVPELSAKTFRQMVRLDQDYEITIAWLKHVPADQLDSYVESMRIELGPDFVLSRPGRNEDGQAPDRYFPITFFETTSSNTHIAGVDPSALPGRLASMTQALSTGEAAMVTGIGILTDPDDLSGSLTFAPVFDSGEAPINLDERWEMLRGFVGYGLRLSKLLELGNVNPQTGKEDILFQILEIPESGEPRLLATQFNEPGERQWIFESQFTIGGQQLLIRAMPSSEYVGAARWPHLWVSVGGLIFTLLVLGIIRVLLTRNQRVQREVREKTGALDAALEKERYTSASLKGVLDAAEQVAIIATQKNGLIRLFNIGAENILGYRASELVDRHTPLAFHDPDEVESERQRLMARSGATLEPFDVFTFDYRDPGPATWSYIRRDGARRQVRLMVSPIRLADRVDGWLGVAVDVTEQIAVEAELRRADQMLKALTRNVPGVVYQFCMDAQGQMSFPYASDGIYQVYEISTEEARESAERAIERIHPDDKDQVIHALEESARTLTRWKADYRVVLPSRGVRWLRGESSPQRADDGGTLWHGYLADITELKELEQRLRDEATIDPLTGLHNRRQLQMLVQAEMVQFERSGEPLSLVMVDLDHFKALNDRYGHDIGDDVLRLVGTLLLDTVRTSDVVFRLGGEEMLVLCPGTELEEAVVLAEKLRRQVRNADMPFDDHITASFGVAAVMPGEDLSDIMKRADDMLYRAKREGRNRVVGLREGPQA